jgi:hypothetical protein
MIPANGPEQEKASTPKKKNWITPNIELISKNAVEAKNAPAVHEPSSSPGFLS